MPRDGLYRIGVAFQRVELRFQITEIPNTNSLVGRTRGQNRLGCRVEGNGVDSIAVLAFRRSSCTSGIILAGVKDLKRDVIGDGSDERGV